MGSLVVINILGAVCLLLWGVRMVRTGVMRAFGARLRRWAGAFAVDRWRGFAAGLGLTGLLQSSAATSLVVASFAERRLIPVRTGLAVMLGADVGSSLVVLAFSFHAASLAPVFIAAGVIAFTVTAREVARHVGRALLGLGLVLLSLDLLGQSAAPLRESGALAAVLASPAADPVLAFAVAAALAWFAHSSVAVVLLIVSFASMQVLGPQTAVPLVLGANLGGAIIPAVLTARADSWTRRITMGNLLMRGALALALLWPLLALARGELLFDFKQGHHAAALHLGFNFGVALFFLPTMSLMERAMARLVPEPQVANDHKPVIHLDPVQLTNPPLALACAVRETLRMGDEVAFMLERSMEALRRDDPALVRQIEASDDALDAMHEAIKLYLIKLLQDQLDEEESAKLVAILGFAANLEHIGDIIDKSLMDLATKRIKRRYAFSQDGLDELAQFHARVSANLQRALNIFLNGDPGLARALLQEKAEIREAELALSRRHYARVGAGRTESIETSALHLDVLRDLKRINSHLTSVVYPILERAGELAPNRLVAHLQT